MEDWPPGAKFVLGFGKTMMQTMREYVEENRAMLFKDADEDRESAIG
jgi:hypothetical protein